MNKQNLILLVIVVLLISIFGIVIAQEGGGVLGVDGLSGVGESAEDLGVEIGQDDLVVELNNLSSELVLEGYDWLINYSIEEFVDVEVYLEGGDEVVAVISNVSSEGFYRSYLDGSSGAGLGRMVNGSWVGVLDNEGNVVNIKISYDIYEKKKRIDEIISLLSKERGLLG